MMTLDLTGKLNGPNCVLRLTTNMECYWDQAFLAVPADPEGARVPAGVEEELGSQRCWRDRGHA